VVNLIKKKLFKSTTTAFKSVGNTLLREKIRNNESTNKESIHNEKELRSKLIQTNFSFKNCNRNRGNVILLFQQDINFQANV